MKALQLLRRVCFLISIHRWSRLIIKDPVVRARDEEKQGTKVFLLEDKISAHSSNFAHKGARSL